MQTVTKTGSRPNPQDTGINPQTHAPTDYHQALVRIGIVGGVVLWSIYLVLNGPDGADFSNSIFITAVVYFTVSVIVLYWSLRLREQGHSRERLLKRILITFADFGAIAAFMIVAGYNAAILYPVYLSTTIGNGIRYGTRFLYLSMAVSVVAFGGVILIVPYWRENLVLTMGLLASLLVIPMYAQRLIVVLNKTLYDLQRSHEARSRFIANMSHELRTPLHTIISLSDLLKQRANERGESSDEADMLRMVSNSGEHLLTLVNQVLDVARLDAGGVECQKTAFDLFDMLQQVNDIITAQAEVKDLGYRMHVASDVPYAVLGSRDYLSQILINLLGNAVKFTDFGSVTLSVSREPATAAGIPIVFRIEDTGIGMTPAVQARIFEPFSQGDESINRRFGGTGLGLTISRQLAELLGGTLECTSQERDGTTFTLRIPFTQDVETTPLLHDTVRALLIKRAVDDSGEREQFARGDWAVDVHTVDSALERLDRRESDGAVRAVIIDAGSFGTRSDRIADYIRGHVSHCPPLVLLGQPLIGNSHDYRHFLTQLDTGVEPGALHRVAHLLEALTLREEGSMPVAGPDDSFTILVADDNVTNQRTAKLVLESAGHRVTVVDDGEEALDALERGVYDLAFMDMHMPNMSGIEAAKLYQFIQPVERTPIVMLTADATESAKTQADSAKVNGYLTKPIRASELLAAVRVHARQSASAPAPIARLPIAPPSEGKVVNLVDAVVDPTEVRQLLELGSDLDEVAQLVEEFIADTRVQLRQVHELYEKQQWSAARDIMHAMKGAAATIGAVAIAKRAAQLEKSTIEDLREQGQLDVAELRGIVDRTQPALRNIIRPNGVPRSYGEAM